MYPLTQSDITRAEKQAKGWLKVRNWYDDDIISAARKGLIDAARTWKKDGGESFKSWAYRKILGAMVQECRRRFGRYGNKVAPMVEVEEEYDTGTNETPQFKANAWSPNPENAILAVIYHEQLMRNLDKKRKRRYISYRFGGKTMKQIGQEEGLTEARIHQTISPTITKFAEFRRANAKKRAC
jgi:RNA polymerase sigma factor (sigma-70 family)